MTSENYKEEMKGLKELFERLEEFVQTLSEKRICDSDDFTAVKEQMKRIMGVEEDLQSLHQICREMVAKWADFEAKDASDDRIKADAFKLFSDFDERILVLLQYTKTSVRENAVYAFERKVNRISSTRAKKVLENLRSELLKAENEKDSESVEMLSKFITLCEKRLK